MAEDTAQIPAVNIDVAQERLKPRVVALLFFDFANQAENSKLNLLGIFDRLRVNPETKRTNPIGVFLRTSRTFDSETFITVYDPNGEMVAGASFGIDKSEAEKFIQTQVLIRLQFDASIEGLYWFDVSYQGSSIGGAPLLLEFKPLKDGDKDGHSSGDA